jgi:hypothetical protein
MAVNPTIGRVTLSRRKLGKYAQCPLLKNTQDPQLALYDLASALHYGSIKDLLIPFSNTNAAEQTTLNVVPVDAIIVGVVVQITTNATGGTLSVGLENSAGSGGSSTALVNNASLASVGYLIPDTAVTAGANCTYVSGTTLGSYMYVTNGYAAGSNVTNGWGQSIKRLIGYPIELAPTIQYVSYTTSNNTVTGFIHVLYIEPDLTEVGAF